MTYPEIHKMKNVWQLEGEIWLDVKGHEGKYQVSNIGRVRRLQYTTKTRNQTIEFDLVLSNLVLNANNDSRGYPQVSLSNPRRVARVHRLVAEAFLPEPSQEVVEECQAAGLDYVLINHIDKNKCNPNKDNLEWCSPKYNQTHSKSEYVAGIRKISGSKNVVAILTEEDVCKILCLLRAGISQQKVGDMFGVKQITISNIWTGRSWAHFTGIPWTPRTRKQSNRKAKSVSSN